MTVTATTSASVSPNESSGLHIQKQDAVIKVRRTVLNQENDDVSYIDIRPFATTPAQVTFSGSRTINMGNYESIKVSVAVTMPCYREEIIDVLKQVESTCDVFLANKIKQIEDELSVQTPARTT